MEVAILFLSQAWDLMAGAGSLPEACLEGGAWNALPQPSKGLETAEVAQKVLDVGWDQSQP